MQKPKLADPGALIRGGKLRTATFQVCLDPDLIAEHERLVEERDAAKAAASDSLAGGSVVELDQQIAELLARMQHSTIELVFRALPRPEFRRLMDKHPPRKDDEGTFTHARDIRVNVNYDVFFDELLHRTLVEPNLDAETVTLLLEERLTEGQYVDLTTLVWNLNQESVSVPFSPAASQKTRSSSPR